MTGSGAILPADRTRLGAVATGCTRAKGSGRQQFFFEKKNQKTFTFGKRTQRASRVNQ
jgi:hypothetical protein